MIVSKGTIRLYRLAMINYIKPSDGTEILFIDKVAVLVLGTASAKKKAIKNAYSNKDRS